MNPLRYYKNPALVNNHNNGIDYAIPTYPVLVGKSTKVYPTNPFASLPRCDKFLVKEKLHDPTRFVRVKLVLEPYWREVKWSVIRLADSSYKWLTKGKMAVLIVKNLNEIMGFIT